MKKFAIHLPLFLSMILTLGSVSYSQDSGSNTPSSNRAELVSLCEKASAEVEVSRDLIKAYQRTLDEYEKSLSNADALIKLDAAQIANLKAQRDAIAEALKKEHQAFEAKSAEATQLRKDLAKATKKKNFFKKMAKVGWITAIAAGAGLVLVSQ